jgi:biopolymer transport protein ExbB/TolQ
MGVDVMAILWIAMVISICLIVVDIVMLNDMKKRNEAWWRTYWAKNKVMMDKILGLEDKANG